jgi:hypothetical protein
MRRVGAGVSESEPSKRESKEHVGSSLRCLSEIGFLKTEERKDEVAEIALKIRKLEN